MMDIIGSFIGTVLGPMVANPAMKVMAMGFAVKWATDQLQALAAKLDAQGLGPKEKVSAQLLVVVCTSLVSLGNMALTGQLHTINVAAVVNFVTVALPTYLAALGIHFGAKAALKAASGKETVKEAVKALRTKKE